MLDRQGSDATDDVSRLLAAAAASTSPEELHGEALAMAQFRAAAPLSPVPAAERAPLMTRMIRKLVAAPIITLGVAGAAITTGGVALAASHGAMHVPFTGHDNRSSSAPAAPSTTNPGLSTHDGSTTPSGPATPAATPSPSLVGLCHAYQAGATHADKANPAFTALDNAANGAANVSTYCVALIGTPPMHPAHPAKPVHPAHPATPAHPTHPAEPTKPTHPATPAQSVKPVHPAHPIKPTH